MRPAILTALALLLVGCGHGHHAEHHGHHHHGGALKEGELKPLMQEMLVHAGALRGALEGGSVADAATHADKLAKICGDGGPIEADPNLFGDEFGAWDKKLHTRAADLAARASGGDLAALKTTYNSVVEACVGCHNQSSLASKVELGPVATPFE